MVSRRTSFVFIVCVSVLTLALRCRVNDTLVIAGRVLAELPGAGQVAHAPDVGALGCYLDRIRRQSSQRSGSRKPLLGELLSCGKGKYGTRCAAAVPRVVELLQNSSERERLETATAALAPDLNRKPTPKKSVLKVEHACAVNAAAEATAECARAVNALTQHKRRRDDVIAGAVERAEAGADKRVAQQVVHAHAHAHAHAQA